MNTATPLIVAKDSLQQPLELPLQDIQGLVLCDYRLPMVRHFFVRVDQAEDGRNLIGALINNPQASLQITTAAHWTQEVRPSYALNVGFTYSGLQALRLPEATLASFHSTPAFMQGAAARAVRIGDCGKSAPENWRGHLQSEAVHMMFSLYAEKSQIEALSVILGRLVRKYAGTILQREDGAELEEENGCGDNLPGILIHFGYRDGISQPIIEGAPRPEYAATNGRVVKAGAFLLGHPSQWLEFQYTVPHPPEFGHNGSFVAFRMLEQNVAEFARHLTAAAQAADISEELMAAKICGRWRNGVALTPATQSELPPVPRDEELNNFTFSDDANGLACPFDAHTRRTNPRADAVAGADGDRHPVIRRGIPYGPKYDPNTVDTHERGLLGLFIGANIEDHFEFLMTNWINRGGFRPELPSHSKDLIAANNTLGDTSFQLPTASGHSALPTFADFVTTRGAAYCFLPSMTGLKYIADL